MVSTMTPSIHYVRSQGQFVVALPNGTEVTTPTRQEAERAHLHAVAPDLAERVNGLAASLPELADRAHRAALIVLADGVQLTPGRFRINHQGIQIDALATVQSQSHEDGAYEIFCARGQLVCNCPDANPQVPDEPGAPPSKFAEHTCKHILAVLLSD